jgi:hypothetical protein
MMLQLSSGILALWVPGSRTTGLASDNRGEIAFCDLPSLFSMGKYNRGRRSDSCADHESNPQVPGDYSSGESK